MSSGAGEFNEKGGQSCFSQSETWFEDTRWLCPEQPVRNRSFIWQINRHGYEESDTGTWQCGAAAAAIADL
jgi:hypothetical protein